MKDRIDQLLEAAQADGLVDAGLAEKLADLAARRDRERAVLGLGSAIGRLGAAATVIGIILLVAANWPRIGNWVKIAGLVVLLVGVHGAALWIHWTRRPYPRFAESLHIVGAGLFLAGLALVRQIYHLPFDPGRGMLLWLAAIAPLAILLRSPGMTALAILAAWAWLHFEAADPSSPLHVTGFTAFLVISIGMGLALLGAQTWLAQTGNERRIKTVLRDAARLMLFYGIYALGFFNRFSEQTPVASPESLALPLGALALGAAGIVVGWNRLASDTPWLRGRLLALLVVLLATCVAALLVDIGVIPRGPNLSTLGSRWFFRYTVATMAIAAAAWAVWFLFALWLVAYGLLSRQKSFVNIGVQAVGLGIVTRFLDLIMGLARTGKLFVFAGIVLLGTAWAMERWRRAVVARIERAA
jgi:uncharacterized membrane protein